MSKTGKIIGLVVGIIVAGAIATGVTVVVIKFKQYAPIWKALEKFNDKNPLKLKYIKDKIQADEGDAKRALRLALVDQDKTNKITNDIAANITFGDQQIVAGKTSTVTAIYKRKKITISVKEDEKPSLLTSIFFHVNQEYLDTFLTQSLIQPRYCY